MNQQIKSCIYVCVCMRVYVYLVSIHQHQNMKINLSRYSCGSCYRLSSPWPHFEPSTKLLKASTLENVRRTFADLVAESSCRERGLLPRTKLLGQQATTKNQKGLTEKRHRDRAVIWVVATSIQLVYNSFLNGDYDDILQQISRP